MENTPRLYDTLIDVLSQHQNWTLAKSDQESDLT